MRLQELFLVETTEEDRAIISLSTAIYQHLKKYQPEYDFDDNRGSQDTDYDSFDDLDDQEDSDVDTAKDELIKIGKIGDLFDTPLEGLRHINIELQSDYGIRLRRKEEAGATVVKAPGEEDIAGLWYGNTNTIVLNRDELVSITMPTVISHELRHALDDIKSDYEANKDKGRYSTPKKKEHRKVKNDPYVGNLSYLAEPAEINARFLQVLHDLVPVIGRAAKLEPNTGDTLIMSSFKKLLKLNRISELFPEGTNSRDYKRLIKRGMDFINKELEYKRKNISSSNAA